ncbi:MULTISPECIES: GspH/FimT family pseudopilin [unclassified Stenotrophomonas]|uniref:GspH/FimT family pseudopilin n=1 Tax=unclassified Stenotrophomonas TaxID=196198 RepID=UPI002117AFB1|nr:MULTISPECIES: GspH/FimT family pseudopilin [unclassified Stenotrophomonas]
MLLIILIAAVLSAMALPSLQDMLGRIRAEALRGQLVSLLSTARSTAITRRQPIEACPSSDGSSCGSDWSHGWLLYPALPPSTLDAAPLPPLLVERRPRAGLQAVSNRARVQFRADGRTGGNNLSIRVCVKDTLHSKVVVSVPGRIRTQRPRRPTLCQAP